MDENYIDLVNLFKALKKRWVLIVICTLVVSLCTMGFTYFLIKPEYQSTVKMFIGKDDVLDTKNQGYSNSDVSMYQSLLKTYGEIIRTKDLVKRAINNSGYNISAGQVISNLSVETLTNTQVIKVTYTGKSPEAVSYTHLDVYKRQKVDNLVEKPAVEEAPSNVAILGRYIITPRIFNILDNTVPGKNNEIQLTDALLKLLKEEDMYAYDFEGKRYDAGDKLGFLEATVEYALRRPELKDGFMKYLKTIVK